MDVEFDKSQGAGSVPGMEKLLSRLSPESLGLLTQWQELIVKAGDQYQKDMAREMGHLGYSRRRQEDVSGALRAANGLWRGMLAKMNAHGAERAAMNGLAAEACDGSVRGELRHPIATCIRESYGEREILVSGRWYLLDASRSRGE